MADLAQMKAQLKELKRKANDSKYPADLREQFDQQANDLEVKILRATKGSGMDKKDPEFMKGGTVKYAEGGFTGKKYSGPNKDRGTVGEIGRAHV